VNAEAFLDELKAQGIRLEPLPNGNLYAAPRERLTVELIERIRQHKPALLAHFHAKQQCALADEALALLRRLKCFALPAGRMPAASEIAERCTARLALWDHGEPVSEADDAVSILAILRDIERELTAIGGYVDPELVETVEMVEHTFPGARLVKIR
jgi:TubC N-terminal docking domain